MSMSKAMAYTRVFSGGLEGRRVTDADGRTRGGLRVVMRYLDLNHSISAGKYSPIASHDGVPLLAKLPLRMNARQLSKLGIPSGAIAAAQRLVAQSARAAGLDRRQLKERLEVVLADPKA